MTADSDIFAEETLGALVAAIEFVGQETVRDSVVDTEWVWDVLTDAGRGELRMPTVGALGTRVTVLPHRGPEGAERIAGALGPAKTLSLLPGTYILRASAAGFVDAEITREVLPGIATVVRFNLVDSIGQAIGYACKAIGRCAIDFL